MTLALIGAALPEHGFRVTVETHNYKLDSATGRYVWMFEPSVSNSKYVGKFDRDEITQEILDDGYEHIYGSVDSDAVFMRFCDTVSADKAAAFRFEGADCIKITDMDSACGEPYALIDSSCVWYTNGVRDGENYLRAVKRVFSSCGNGYEAARKVFADVKAEHGIIEARKAFRMMLFEAKLSYGEYDPNGYGNGSWHAKSEAQFLPMLRLALEAGNN